ncbi:MAG: rod shape-determining protein MreD [Ilumatobacteraceae bacterium]
MNRVLTIASNRWTRLVLVALGLLGLQTTLLSQLRPFGVMLPLMLLFAVTTGTVHGSEVGAITGLVIGAMYDCVLTTPFGLASLVIGTAGYLAGLLPFFVREPTWWSRALVVAVASAIGEMMFPVAQWVVGLDGWLQPHVFWIAAVVALFNGLLAPLFVPLSRWTLREPVRT